MDRFALWLLLGLLQNIADIVALFFQPLFLIGRLFRSAAQRAWMHTMLMTQAFYDWLNRTMTRLRQLLFVFGRGLLFIGRRIQIYAQTAAHTLYNLLARLLAWLFPSGGHVNFWRTIKLGIAALLISVPFLLLILILAAKMAPDPYRDTAVAVAGFVWIFGKILWLWLRGGRFIDVALFMYFAGKPMEWQPTPKPVQNGKVEDGPALEFTPAIDGLKMPIRLLMIIAVVDIIFTTLAYLLPVEEHIGLTLMLVMVWLGWLLTAYIMERVHFDWYKWVGKPLFAVLVGGLITLALARTPLSKWIEKAQRPEYVTKRQTLAAYCDCRYEGNRLVRKLGDREKVSAGVRYRAVRKDARIDIGSMAWMVVNPARDNDPKNGYDENTVYLVPKKDLSSAGRSGIGFSRSASAQPAPASTPVTVPATSASKRVATTGFNPLTTPLAIGEFEGAIEVPANYPAADTELEILPGQTVTIKAIGEVMPTKDTNYTEPVGPKGHPRYSSGAQVDNYEFLTDAPVGALIGKVGDGEWFYIGEHTTLIKEEIGAGGKLLLAVNKRQSGSHRSLPGKFLAKVTIE